MLISAVIPICNEVETMSAITDRIGAVNLTFEQAIVVVDNLSIDAGLYGEY